MNSVFNYICSSFVVKQHFCSVHTCLTITTAASFYPVVCKNSPLCSFASASKAVDILEAYEGTLEDDYPPDNERCEHGEMLLYKVIANIIFGAMTGLSVEPIIPC